MQHKYYEPTYLFKLLSFDEIADYLQKKNISIEKTQLNNINQLWFAELIVHLLTSMNIVKREELELTFKEHSSFSFPQMHEKQVFLLKIFYKLKPILLNSLNIKDFTTEDLFTPNQQKSNVILSGLISLHITFDKISPIIGLINQEQIDTDNEIIKVKRLLEESEEEKEMIASKFQEEKNSADQKIDEITIKNKILSEKKALIEEKNNELKKINEKDRLIRDKISILNSEIDIVTNKINDLTTKIVESPSEINDCIKMQELIIKSFDSLERLFNTLKSKIVNFEKDSNEIKSLSIEVVVSYNNYIKAKNEMESALKYLEELKHNLKSNGDLLFNTEKDNLNLKEEEMILIKQLKEEDSMFSIQQHDLNSKIKKLKEEKADFAKQSEILKNNLKDLKISYSNEENEIEEMLVAEEKILKEYDHNINLVVQCIDNLSFSMKKMLPYN
jgi:hypothetical protein